MRAELTRMTHPDQSNSGEKGVTISGKRTGMAPADKASVKRKEVTWEPPGQKAKVERTMRSSKLAWV